MRLVLVAFRFLVWETGFWLGDIKGEPVPLLGLRLTVLGFGVTLLSLEFDRR